MRRLNYFWFFLCLGFSSFAQADDYYWKRVGSWETGPSPFAVCSDVAASMETSTYRYEVKTVTLSSATSASCTLNRINKSTGASTAQSSWGIARQGDTCPDGTVIQTTDPYSDTCYSDNPCASKTGASSRFNKSGSGGDGYYEFSGNYGSPSQDGCFGGCTANTADQKCTSNLSTMTYSCRGTMYYTGAQCTTSPAPEVDETTDTSTPVPQAYSDYTPCQYTTNAQGVQVCVSSSSEGKEGQYCGTVNGVKTCIDAKPTHNGIEITTKVETTNNPDGSTTVVKTDTANSTKCSGFNCTTSTTTSTTTTSKNGSGETTSVTGSCTGPQCPDKNTNPDGDGDGFGDCIGDDCAGGGGAGVESPELDEVPGYGDSLATYWGDIQDAPIVSAVTSITLPSGGSCPTYTATIDYVGTVSTAVACDLAVSLLMPLQYLFLAIWAFVAVRTTMTA